MSDAATITRSGTDFTIDFGSGVVFAGTIEDDNVRLAYVHAHDFFDGCDWQASEALVGRLRSDCTISLSYDYVEAVVVDDGSCASPCSAMANVTLDLR